MEKGNGQMHEARFLSLVLSLHGSAWMALGKVANPLSGKLEKDLDAARGSIDLLETLKVKTRGNLTKEEEKVLANALSALQLNFVDELTRGEGKGKESPPAAEAAAGGETSPPAQDKGPRTPDTTGGEGPSTGGA